MVWIEAPASRESRRSTAIPHPYRHRASSRLYRRMKRCSLIASSGAEGRAESRRRQASTFRLWGSCRRGRFVGATGALDDPEQASISEAKADTLFLI